MLNNNNTCDSLWSYDDLTKCGIYIVQIYPPIIFAATSIVFLAYHFWRNWRFRSKSRNSSLESRPLLSDDNDYGSIVSKRKNASLKDRHFDLKQLPDTLPDGTPHGSLQQVVRSSADTARIAVEYMLVFVMFCFSISVHFVPELSSYFPFSAAFTNSIFWGYLFVLNTVRIVNNSKANIKQPNIWAHCTTIYLLNLIPIALLFRSALIKHDNLNPLVFEFYLGETTISVILVLLNFSATVGDKPVTIYVPNDNPVPSPELNCSIFSSISFSWFDPLVWTANHKVLQKQDIWGLIQDDYALNILKGFQDFTSFTSFAVRLFANFKELFAYQFFWSIFESLLIFIPSIMLKEILEYVKDPISYPKSLAWTFVLMMPVCKLMEAIVESRSLFIGRRISLRMRSVIIGEVYAKALRRNITYTSVDDKEDKDNTNTKTDSSVEDSQSSTNTAELGEIINLMAIDAFKISEGCAYLHFFVTSIIMLIISVFLLYGLLGWSSCVGSLVLVAMMFVNFKMYAYQGRVQEDKLKYTDKRIQKLNETIQAIRFIKFFAWEDNSFASVMKFRKEELNHLKAYFLSWTVVAFIWFISPTLVTLLSFYCYSVIEGKVLTAPIAFTALSLFSLLRIPLDQFSEMSSFVIQCKVSLDRVARFLDEEETSKYEQLDHERGPNSPEIGFESASFTWNSSAENEFKLRDLSIDFKVGKLNIIIGPTGAGKTSLLMALLGEMELITGKVFLPGIIPRDELVVDPQTGLTESVAYCSQAPWLLNDTIKNNIIFGSTLNEDRYKRVIEACGLSRDLEILSAGDATEIGEKGITLSGGQKQRVSLARALYSNSKHVLLDDCLSAVDSHTALWIYENCVSGPLMTGRTCILVSHNVALTVQNAAWIVVMDNGRVKNQGTPHVLLASGDLGDDDLVKSSVISSRDASTSNLQSLDDKNAELKTNTAEIENNLKVLSKDSEGEDKTKKHDGKLVDEEGKAEGVVDLSVYTGYAKYFGGFLPWFVTISLFALSQGAYMIQTYWLKIWSVSSESDNIFFQQLSSISARSGFVSSQISGIFHLITSSVKVDQLEEKHGQLYYIYIYGIIGLFYAIAASYRIWVTFSYGINAADRIFQDVLTRILKAKVRFFDRTPVGRIMNRFSKDIEAVDEELISYAEGAFINLIQCITTLVLITFITPGFLIFASVCCILYYAISYFYISLSRELKRFESITKSPIHQHFSESLNGVATIRAYGIESRFMKQNIEAIDNNNRPFFYLWVANRWCNFRMDLCGSLVLFFAGIFILLSVGNIDAGLAGISLSYAIAFSESAIWFLRLYVTVEMNMNSFERLQEYLEVEQEAPYEIPETEPVASWPEAGRISVKNVSLRYAPELPRVIKNVSFDVEPNQKVGIVGRTGAGKSTIITALFRFLDPETGSIHIDGIDITKIGLKNLRQAITIIPQDPTLFTGTIRSNLDPSEQYSDSSIFEALRRVNLIGADELLTSENPVAAASNSDDENQNKFLNLDSAIAEGGGNLSQGERQLVCLARSLLKNPKVMLLDEATSSIDYKSDTMIQETIRQEFSNSTILTIAHRLRTIIDYDKILVMDAGEVVEYDNPYVLISNKESLFYSMCENSGELDSLIELAKEATIQRTR